MCCYGISGETDSLHFSLPISMETKSEDWDSPVQVAVGQLQSSGTSEVVFNRPVPSAGGFAAPEFSSPGGSHRGPEPAHGCAGPPGRPYILMPAGLCSPQERRQGGQAGPRFLDSAYRASPAHPQIYPRVL